MKGNENIKDLIHLPDVRFVKWCENTYLINRGVYNTIDGKLYDAGFQNIYERRKATIRFLEKHVQLDQKAKFYKFCHGNLSVALNQFSAKNFSTITY